jgi:hypothetical protein
VAVAVHRRGLLDAPAAQRIAARTREPTSVK